MATAILFYILSISQAESFVKNKKQRNAAFLKESLAKNFLLAENFSMASVHKFIQKFLRDYAP